MTGESSLFISRGIVSFIGTFLVDKYVNYYAKQIGVIQIDSCPIKKKKSKCSRLEMCLLTTKGILVKNQHQLVLIFTRI